MKHTVVEDLEQVTSNLFQYWGHLSFIFTQGKFMHISDFFAVSDGPLPR